MEIAKALFEFGFDANTADNYGKTPLYYVCEQSGYFELAELLLEYMEPMSHHCITYASAVMIGRCGVAFLEQGGECKHGVRTSRVNTTAYCMQME